MIDIEEKLRGDVRAARAARGKPPLIDRSPRALGYGSRYLFADLLSRRRTHDRAQRRRWICWIAENVFLRQGNRAGDKFIVQALVHVDSLDAAAGLAAVEERAVHEVLNRMGEIRIVTHVRRIAATELETCSDKTGRRGALNGVPSLPPTP